MLLESSRTARAPESRERRCLKIPNKQIKTKITNKGSPKPQTTTSSTTINKTKQNQNTKAKPNQSKPTNQPKKPNNPKSLNYIVEVAFHDWWTELTMEKGCFLCIKEVGALRKRWVLGRILRRASLLTQNNFNQTRLDRRCPHLINAALSGGTEAWQCVCGKQRGRDTQNPKPRVLFFFFFGQEPK